MSKTENSYRNSPCLPAIAAGLLIALLLASPALPAATPLENQIMKALGSDVRCKNMAIQIRQDKEKPGEMKSLAFKLEEVKIGEMVADHMTVMYEKPVIDLDRLNKANKFKVLSSSRIKVGILVSAGSLERYIAARARQLRKKYNRMSIKFSPPYAECQFDVPASEISPEALKLLDKFIKGGKLEGYAALQFKARNNALSAESSKVILNHFLIPDVLLKELQTRFNPFDSVPVLSPFNYSINSVSVQSNYLFLSN